MSYGSTILCVACIALAAALPKTPTTTATTSALAATQQTIVKVIFTAPTTPAPTATSTSIPMLTPSPTLVPTLTNRSTPTTVVQVQPTPKPTPKPTPQCKAVNNNPWCYNFDSTGGSLITNPPSNFCSYFPCIATFWAADDPDGGYVVQCADGDFSQSGGESGSCSHHGGDGQPLYSH